MKGVLAFILIGGLFVAGCKKKDDEVFPPTIEIVSLSATTVKQFDNAVVLKLHYEDADGDLGYHNPDSLTLSIKDSRLRDADMYHIPPLAPDSTEINIQGELEIDLQPFFLLGKGSTETTQLTVKIKDHAGNWSNEAISSTITITQ